MKKFKIVVGALLLFLANISTINAACSSSETNKLRSLAMNVRPSYELAEKELPIDDEYNYPDGLTQEELDEYKDIKKYFNVYISNLTEELYVQVKDSQSGKTKRYDYSDTKDGVITIEQDDLTSVNNYTITVYSSSTTGCPDTKLYTTKLTTPYYNSYSAQALCEGIEDYYLCHEYLSISQVSYDKFVRTVENYKKELAEKEEQKKEEEKGVANFIKKNRNVIIVSSIIIIAIGGLVTVIIVKKQRSRIV